jgi:hypothetical protein
MNLINLRERPWLGEFLKSCRAIVNLLKRRSNNLGRFSVPDANQMLAQWGWVRCEMIFAMQTATGYGACHRNYFSGTISTQ